jgi:hypothetical protein
MAIVATAKLQLPDSQLPAGSSNDTLSDFSAVSTTKEAFEYALTPASTYDNATQATALTAIKAAIETYAEGTLATAIGLNSALSIVGDVVITSIVRGFPGITSPKTQYLAAVDEFVVNGYFEWHVTV